MQLRGRGRGRPRKIDLLGEDMIRYYIIDKTGPANVIVKGAPDSVALFMHIKNPRDYIVVKCGKSERVVSLVGLDYNGMVTALESA